MNAYQARTSPAKMRGEYYTPLELARLIVRRLRPTANDLVVDPSCGDGSFLCAAIQEGARRLIGLDLELKAIQGARERVEDAFAACVGRRPSEEEVCLRSTNALKVPELPFARGPRRLLIVGNPPYVEAKRLPRELKESLAGQFPGAVVGAPDLCLYFLHVCLGWLRGEDRLAFVLPNKVLVNANAQTLRERLLESRMLRGVWMATRAAIFPGAAVYPVVLFAGAGSDTEAGHVTRNGGGEFQMASPVRIDSSTYQATRSNAMFVPPSDSDLRLALDGLVRAIPLSRLDDVLDIRWTVSFHRKGLREEYVLPNRPPGDGARRFLGGGAFSGNGEVRRYRLSWAGWWMRYDEEEMRARKNSVPAAGMFDAPKVVICQNGRTLRAAFDDRGFVLKDTFLAGLPREVDHPLRRHPRAIVGLLCSRAIHFFYAHVFEGGHVGGGYLHFLRSFLVDIPLGRWSEASAKRVSDLVLINEQGAPDAAVEEEIEGCVSEALSVERDACDSISKWASKDANWVARERVKTPTVGFSPAR